MDDHDLRAHAVRVAYGMLGSMSDAEDVAQETMLRVGAARDRGDVRVPVAFTTTVATRLAIDHLRSARVRRETYVGPWLPEPVRSGTDDATSAAELADSLSFAFLVVLETLGPLERAAFLLHDTFGYGYDDIARVLDRHEPACRQLVARARRRIGAGRPRFAVDRDEHRVLVERFLAASRDGDVEALVAVLAPDATFVSDGGARRKAARHPILGRERVVRFLRKVGPRLLAPATVEVCDINGVPGFVVCAANGEVTVAGSLTIRDGEVLAVHWVTNPEKLRWVGR